MKLEAECDVCGKRETAPAQQTALTNYPMTWINVTRQRQGYDAWLCSWGCVLRYGLEHQNEATA